MSEADDIPANYRLRRPTYEAFSASLDSLIKILLERKGVEYFSIENRTKTLESLDEKTQREDKIGKYSNLGDVTDLSGIRIIAYLQSDCDKICELLRQEFTVDKLNSSRKEDEIDPDKFGYLSTHYVVSISSAREGLFEFSPFKGMKAEIQVRTLLQHTWAAIDWKFRYKEEKQSPKQLRRRLFRISALLEAADNEFSAVNTELARLRSQYTQNLSNGELQIPLNIESIKVFISESVTARSVIESANRSGVTVLPFLAASTLILNRLIDAASIIGIKTLDELDENLKKMLPISDQFFSHIANSVRDYKIQAGKASSGAQLFPAALLRYALMAQASPAKRKAINTKHKPSPGYAEAVASFRSG